MNSASAVTTGAVGLSADVVAQTIDYLMSLAHLPPPPDPVAMGVGVMVLAAAHGLYNLMQARAARSTPAAVAAPVAPSFQPAPVTP